jgi:hypothetical protein
VTFRPITLDISGLLQNLDFDFEKCCCVSLSHVNVYVCLVCGKYFQVGSALPVEG